MGHQRIHRPFAALLLTAGWLWDPERSAPGVAITGAALAAGPVVGGVLTESIGWRAIFLVNVPLALTSLVITLRLAPETARKQRSELDLTGQISSIAALAALVYALIEGPSKGWASVEVLGAFVVTVAAAGVFLAAERRAGGAAMLPLRMFSDRGFSAAVGAGLLANFGLAFLSLALPTAFNPI